jgi:hypothetical protein
VEVLLVGSERAQGEGKRVSGERDLLGDHHRGERGSDVVVQKGAGDRVAIMDSDQTPGLHGHDRVVVFFRDEGGCATAGLPNIPVRLADGVLERCRILVVGARFPGLALVRAGDVIAYV